MQSYYSYQYNKITKRVNFEEKLIMFDNVEILIKAICFNNSTKINQDLGALVGLSPNYGFEQYRRYKYEGFLRLDAVRYNKSK